MSTSVTSPKLQRLALSLIAAALAVIGFAACQPAQTPEPKLAEEIVVYSNSEDRMDAVFDAFTKETGVKVNLKLYESPDRAIEEIRAGAGYDVLVLESGLVPAAVADGLLAPIDFRNVTNFKNISADFRNLAYDPNNKHTIPYSWGTTGLVVRSDRVAAPITRWADLWDPRYAGKTVGWLLPRYTLGAALQRLRDLKPIIVDAETEKAIPTLLSGEAMILVGWPKDALAARRQNEAIAYILPAEGTLLWSDAFVIPASSPHKSTAELFLNFLLRPEIGAQIVNENLYATANQAAYPFVKPEILNNPIIFPPADTIKKADWYLPLSPAGEKLYTDIWERFLTGRP